MLDAAEEGKDAGVAGFAYLCTKQNVLFLAIHETAQRLLPEIPRLYYSRYDYVHRHDPGDHYRHHRHFGV